MRYATVTTWAKVIEKETGLKRAPITLKKRLDEANKIGKTARNRTGKILEGGFYSERDVRDACIRLFAGDLHKADENGFVHLDGVRYGNPKSWIEFLKPKFPATPVDVRTLKKRIEQAELAGIKGISARGKMDDFYAEEDIMRLLEDDLAEHPIINDEGYFELDGEIYRSLKGWSEVFLAEGKSIHNAQIYTKIKRAEAKGVSARSKGQKKGVSKLVKNAFYSEKVVRQVMADELLECPRAESEGSFFFEGQAYRTAQNWGDHSNGAINGVTLRKRWKARGMKGITAKDAHGRLWVDGFFSEHQYRAELDEEALQYQKADKNNCLVIGNERLRTVGGWQKFYKQKSITITKEYLRKLIEKTSLEGVKGRIFNNQVHDFYSESQIRELLGEVGDNVPRANSEGYFVLDGKEYRTAWKWAIYLRSTKKISCSAKRIFRLCTESGRVGITGRDGGGNLHKNRFFSETDVAAVINLGDQIPYVGKDGYFAIEGRQYRTLDKWAHYLRNQKGFSASYHTMKKLCAEKGISGITGKNVKGQILKNRYFSDEDIADILGLELDMLRQK